MTERFLTWDDSGLPPTARGTVLTVGTFDGVHRGHQRVLECIARRGNEHGLSSVVVTFDPHPLEIVRKEAAPPLLTLSSEKIEVIAESGINYLAIVPFTKKLQRYDAAAFVDQILRQRFHVKHLVIGHDHGFGRGRAGDVEVLRRLGETRGFTVEVVSAVDGIDGVPISSTMIRQAVAAGDLERAARLLGRPYSISGRVQGGDRRGRLLGFPTINLGAPPPRKLLPPAGVYAVRAQTHLGPLGGMMNLGARPTFGDETVAIEVHLFDAEGDFYDRAVRIDILARLRDTKKFDNAEALVAQLREDEQQARRALTQPSSSHNVKS
ncbi:MAG: Riboflavin biosynthesis protein [Myxococcaceae bacterium]|nr:Riboflavin biosynthesis protein [Myxococcaceae bacterium]